jgi:hypothetical protein
MHSMIGVVTASVARARGGGARDARETAFRIAPIEHSAVALAGLMSTGHIAAREPAQDRRSCSRRGKLWSGVADTPRRHRSLTWTRTRM